MIYDNSTVSVFGWSGERGEKDTVQMLVAGAGDPRHLLLMLARKRQHKKRLKVFLLEAHVELYARVLLLVGICLQQGLGLRERASLLLDLWSNLNLRPASRNYLELTAQKLSRAVTDATQYQALLGMVSAENLKYRERDAIDAICRSWYTLTPKQYDPALCWDLRLRQLLRTRYDNRQAEADWAWHMRLVHRIQKLHINTSKGGGAAGDNEGTAAGYVGAGWGQEFLKWRDTGHAFYSGADITQHLANTSLASVVMITEGMTKHRRVGYWGDLLTGPFPVLALASTDIRVAQMQNGRSKYGGSEVALWNLENLLHQLWPNHYLQEEQLVQEMKGKLPKEKTNEKVTKELEGKVENAQGDLKNEQLQKGIMKSNVHEKVKRQMKAMVDKKPELVEMIVEQEEEEMVKQMEMKVKKQIGKNKREEIYMELEKHKELEAEQQIELKNDSKDNCVNLLKTARAMGEVLEKSSEEKKIEATMNVRVDMKDEIKNGISDNKTNMNYICKGETSHVTGEKQNTANCIDNQPQIEAMNLTDSRNTGKGNILLPKSGSKSKAEEEGNTSNNYLPLEGVEVILLSPSRLKDLTSLPEVVGGLDLVYLSVAMAHLLTPTLLHSHLRQHTKLILETAQMLPELTDDQVQEFKTRVMSSATAAGWECSASHPLCHLTFQRS
ncbi:Dynein assembly factor 3, axonemal-like 1 [Homarus americanus]|uniref:Dynein assembly factor 3, axonemal-like 1 n=1 Tax=Homarus americanus TaxID=6706 RepID=A0A8J5JSS7_HOMAM|nr:Dynein assembly factor 3, axonemal-like 1 [Homarus americanus]